MNQLWQWWNRFVQVLTLHQHHHNRYLEPPVPLTSQEKHKRNWPCEVIHQCSHQLAHPILFGAQLPSFQAQEDVILTGRV